MQVSVTGSSGLIEKATIPLREIVAQLIEDWRSRH
jgi:hypothetical protein